VPVSGRPLLFLAVLLIFIGIQFISLGLIAELQARTYHESQNKPVYHVKSVYGGRDGKGGSEDGDARQ